MKNETEYDLVIIGGGLAGLSLSILMGRKGYSVALIEKEKYPFHKVCGEYISMESRPFLESLGLDLDELNLPVIDELMLSSPNGRSFHTKLDLGGFGISRYKLDNLLSKLAIENGVELMTETKAQTISFAKNFLIECISRDGGSVHLRSKLCCAAYGKRSNLDVKWNRKFLTVTDKRPQNFVAVKYHVRHNWQENLIGLHNFENGYCGISKIENDQYCLCYLTTASNLKRSENKIGIMEKDVLCVNPHLRKIFSEMEIENEFPVTISQISFKSKTQVENGVLMLGDAAGMITPLCGNGMSMALHSSLIAFRSLDAFLQNQVCRMEMERRYQEEWSSQFSRRLATGRTLQDFFGSQRLSNLFVSIFKTFPFLAKPVVKMTHGKPF